MDMRRAGFAALLMIALLVAGCDDTGTQSSSSELLLPQPIAIDPSFREFYDLLGGDAVLGPAISPLFQSQNIYYQYTVASLLVLDPGAPASQRFSLGPLGGDMGIHDPSVPPPPDPQARYVEGHTIYDLFIPLYEKLGGLRFTGAPLSEVHFNPEKKRYEQFFTNLGFYWIEGDSPEAVHLLAYGVWKCDAACRSQAPGASAVELPYRTAKRFVEGVTRLGADFTGYAITDEYPTPDGYLEQVYENVVLVADPGQPGRVFLRAITERLGYRPDPLKERGPNADDYFYAIQSERGYNIPRRIYDYIAQHSGFEVSGAPISEITRVGDAMYQQCFTNLCIQAFLDPLGQITVRPAPLGYTYRRLPIVEVNLPSGESVAPLEQAAPATQEQPELEAQSQAVPQEQLQELPEEQPQEQPLEQPQQQSQPEPQSQPSPAAPLNPPIVQVWESFPMVAPSQGQEIGVSVFQDGLPVANVEPDLTLSLPDGSQKTYYMYPTGSDGQSRLTIEPVAAGSGTLIPYKVCVYNVGGEMVCVSDTFLVWVNP